MLRVMCVRCEGGLWYRVAVTGILSASGILSGSQSDRKKERICGARGRSACWASLLDLHPPSPPEIRMIICCGAFLKQSANF